MMLPNNDWWYMEPSYRGLLSFNQ